MKKIIILITLIIVLVGAISFVLVKQKEMIQQTNDQNEGSSYIATSTQSFPETEENASSTILSPQPATRDFLFDQEVTQDPNNPGHFFLGNTFTQEFEPEYVITYQQQDDFFNIVLLKEPLRDARWEAENYLRAVLNISNPELCALKYTVSAPLYVSKEQSGIDLKFSFCPGANQL